MVTPPTKILDIASATEYLAARDPILAAVIAAIGPCPLTQHTEYYQALVDSILGQQLSVKAAAAIRSRFIALYDGAYPSPEIICNTSIEKLRSAGLSRSKAAYIQDLATHILDGRIDFSHIEHKDNNSIMRELIAVKGIGEWTVHMFLIFCMGRLDVLPVGDLGIRTGIMRLYGLATLPTPTEVRGVADKHAWHPYESIASWYVWQSLTLK